MTASHAARRAYAIEQAGPLAIVHRWTWQEVGEAASVRRLLIACRACGHAIVREGDDAGALAAWVRHVAGEHPRHLSTVPYRERLAQRLARERGELGG